MKTPFLAPRRGAGGSAARRCIPVDSESGPDSAALTYICAGYHAVFTHHERVQVSIFRWGTKRVLPASRRNPLDPGKSQFRGGNRDPVLMFSRLSRLSPPTKSGTAPSRGWLSSFRCRPGWLFQNFYRKNSGKTRTPAWKAFISTICHRSVDLVLGVPKTNKFVSATELLASIVPYSDIPLDGDATPPPSQQTWTTSSPRPKLHDRLVPLTLANHYEESLGNQGNATSSCTEMHQRVDVFGPWSPSFLTRWNTQSIGYCGVCKLACTYLQRPLSHTSTGLPFWNEYRKVSDPPRREASVLC